MTKKIKTLSLALFIALFSNLTYAVEEEKKEQSLQEEITEYINHHVQDSHDFALFSTKDKVTEAFKIILSDKNVKGILVNIFGGIMRCDVVAEGVLDAAREINISVPLVVRLEGTNVEEGKRIIEESELEVISGSDLDDAAQKITKAISEVK